MRSRSASSSCWLSCPSLCIDRSAPLCYRKARTEAYKLFRAPRSSIRRLALQPEENSGLIVRIWVVRLRAASDTSPSRFWQCQSSSQVCKRVWARRRVDERIVRVSLEGWHTRRSWLAREPPWRVRHPQDPFDQVAVSLRRAAWSDIVHTVDIAQILAGGPSDWLNRTHHGRGLRSD